MNKNCRNVLFRAGTGVAVAGLLLSLYLFVFSMPQIGRGLWPQSEYAVAVLFVSAALCALGLLMMSARTPRLVYVYCIHPYVLITAGIGGISGLLAVSHDLPVRSFLGSPQSGEGVVWWFDFAVLIATFMVIFRLRFMVPLLFLAGTLSALTTLGSILAFMHGGWPYVPFYFADFLAVSIIALFPFYVCTFGGGNGKRRALVCIFLYGLFLWLVYLAGNVVGFAFFLCAVPFFTALSIVRGPSVKTKEVLTYVALLSLIVLAAGVLFVSYQATGQSGFYDFEVLRPLRNIVSRAYMVDIILSSLAGNPLSVFTGTGWGSYTEHVISSLPADWFDFMRENKDQWEGVLWDQFHSHNIFAEALFSAGIAALLALVALVVAVPYFAQAGRFYLAALLSAAYASIGSFWFFFPHNLPFVAMGFAYVGRRIKPCVRFGKTWFRTVLAVLTVVQAGAGFVVFSTVTRTHHYAPAPLDVSQARDACPSGYVDYGAGGLHLAKMLTTRSRALTLDIAKEDDAPSADAVRERIMAINPLYCQARKYGQGPWVSKRLLISLIIVRGEFLFGVPDLDQATRDFYEAGWADDLARFLAVAPHRSDQAVPYLLYMMNTQNERAAVQMAGMIYAQDPDDPVGLWFSGIGMMADANRAGQGLARMQRALESGIERFLPVEQEIKDMIRQGVLRSGQ